MKKFYAAVAMAALVSASAMAATEDLRTAPMRSFAGVGENTLSLSTSDKTKAPAKEAIAQTDVNFTYMYHYTSMSSGDNGGDQEHNLFITFDGSQAGDMNGENCTINGLFDEFAVRAVFNANTGTIRIYPGQKFFFNTYYNEYLTLYTAKATNIAQDIPYYEFQYTSEGSQLTNNSTGESWLAAKGGFMCADLTNMIYITIPSMKGSNNGWEWMYQAWLNTVEFDYPKAAFNYVESEWTSLGTASFVDGWFAGITVGEPFAAYNVEVKQNTKNPNQYALINPFGKGTPYAEYNTTPEAEGKVVFEVITEEVEGEDLSTVVVLPFQNSGFKCPWYTDIEEAFPYLCTNVEGGKYYFNDATVEDIMYDLEDLKLDMSTVSEDGKTITITNARIQRPGEPTNSLYQYTNQQGQPVSMVSVIVLPGGAGVEGVLNDAEAGEARYFNLQGMEVANPEAGQLVIKSQGGKSTKMIVR